MINATSAFNAIIALLSAVTLIGGILIIKAIAKGASKAKEVAGYAKAELDKVDAVIDKLAYVEVNPPIGKVESIGFYLNEEDESLFYAIPPKYLKRLRPKLEKLVKELENNNQSYGHQYAERCFYIGNRLIVSWRNEVKV